MTLYQRFYSFYNQYYLQCAFIILLQDQIRIRRARTRLRSEEGTSVGSADEAVVLELDAVEEEVDKLVGVEVVEFVLDELDELELDVEVEVDVVPGDELEEVDVEEEVVVEDLEGDEIVEKVLACEVTETEDKNDSLLVVPVPSDARPTANKTAVTLELDLLAVVLAPLCTGAPKAA